MRSALGSARAKVSASVGELGGIDRAARPVAIEKGAARGVDPRERDAGARRPELEERLDLGRDGAPVEPIGIEEAADEIAPEIVIAGHREHGRLDLGEEGVRRGELGFCAALRKVARRNYQVRRLGRQIGRESRRDLDVMVPEMQVGDVGEAHHRLTPCAANSFRYGLDGG